MTRNTRDKLIRDIIINYSKVTDVSIGEATKRVYEFLALHGDKECKEFLKRTNKITS